MEFLDVIQKRYSVRKFLPTEVEKEKIDQILEAGRIAPSAHNLQPVVVRILKGEEVDAMQVASAHLYHAPLALVVCYDKTKAWTREFDQMNMGIVDGSIAATQMMLMATNLGLGSVWVGHFDPSLLHQHLSLDSNLEVVCILPMGYPDPTYTASSLHYERKPRNEFVQ